jgi:hypothetical protein
MPKPTTTKPTTTTNIGSTTSGTTDKDGGCCSGPGNTDPGPEKG